MPEEIGNGTLHQEEAVTYCSNNITAMQWNNKRDGLVLTTIHFIDFVETRKM
jgi:hypothetical protein